MSFHMNTIGLKKLLSGEQVEIGAMREIVHLSLDAGALDALREAGIDEARISLLTAARFKP